MAISVHGGGVAPVLPPTAAERRRPPVPVLLAGLLAVVEAIGLLAVALHGLDPLVTAPGRPAAPVVALVLLGLAVWIVLAAGSGAMVVDGSSRRLLVGVAVGELVLLAPAAALALVAPGTLPAGLPALLLPAVAVPVAKLLLAGAPSCEAWLAAGPRVVELRPDPAAMHRGLATATLGVIGVALGAIALLGPVADGANTGPTVSTTVHQP